MLQRHDDGSRDPVAGVGTAAQLLVGDYSAAAAARELLVCSQNRLAPASEPGLQQESFSAPAMAPILMAIAALLNGERIRACVCVCTHLTRLSAAVLC
jgi:hypothetical protein